MAVFARSTRRPTFAGRPVRPASSPRIRPTPHAGPGRSPRASDPGQGNRHAGPVGDPARKATYSLPAPHGGGYDDIAFLNGRAYLTASSPTLNAAGVNTLPALVSVTLGGGLAVLTPVLQGNATATDLKTGGTVSLNAIDPDTLTVASTGALVMSNQAANQLVFVNNPGASNQSVGVLGPTNSVDDTAFASSTQGRLLVADQTTGTIYSIFNTGGFTVGAAYSALLNDGLVSSLDTSTGALTTIVGGPASPRGMVFDSAAPEPGGVALLATGLVAAVALGRRSLKEPAAPVAS